MLHGRSFDGKRREQFVNLCWSQRLDFTAPVPDFDERRPKLKTVQTTDEMLFHCIAVIPAYLAFLNSNQPSGLGAILACDRPGMLQEAKPFRALHSRAV